MLRLKSKKGKRGLFAITQICFRGIRLVEQTEQKFRVLKKKNESGSLILKALIKSVKLAIRIIHWPLGE